MKKIPIDVNSISYQILVGKAKNLGLTPIEERPGFFTYETKNPRHAGHSIAIVIDLTASGNTTEAVTKNLITQLAEKVQKLAIDSYEEYNEWPEGMMITDFPHVVLT